MFRCAFNSSLALALCLLVTPVHADSRLSGDTVVASRGTATVTMADIDASLLSSPSDQRANIMNSPKRIEDLINRLLLNRQLANEARAAKFDQKADVQRSIELSSERILGEQMMLSMRENIEVGNVLQLARERYMVNPDAYTLPGDTTVRHILIASDKHGDEEARAIAEQVHAKAVAGDEFIALVNEYSEDMSKDSNAGVVPGAEGDNIDPAFAAAVKKLTKPSEISPVVKTKFGYHVISFMSRVPPTSRSFDQAKDSIVAELISNLRNQRLKEHVDQLKSMEIEADPDVVASLRTRYLPQETATKTP